MSGLRDELQAIYDQHGRLTPELVVQVARPKEHPLHDRVFDRAPREAAEAWYCARAQGLIRSVRAVYKEADDTGPERSVRVFHSVRREDGHAYVPLGEVVEDEFTRSLLLRDMEREWKQLFARFEQFEEFLSMVANDVTARLAA